MLGIIFFINNDEFDWQSIWSKYLYKILIMIPMLFIP